jgi:NhaP-type Na+/H+ or K+/H+ antiporter
MDIIFVLCSLCLLFIFFYYGRKFSSSTPTSKKSKLISGIIGLIGVIVIFLILRADILPSRNNKLILPTFNTAFPDWAIAIIMIVGIIESVVLIIMGIIGYKGNTKELHKEIKESERGPEVKEIEGSESAINVDWEGAGAISEAIVEIYLDSEIKNKGSFKNGFNAIIKTNSGEHSFSVKVNGRSKNFPLQIEKGCNYNLSLEYSRAWGNFKIDFQKVNN